MRRGYPFRVRYAVRLRREGGSLSLTLPRYITRKWLLVPGDELLAKSTEDGILLCPRFLRPGTTPEYVRSLSGERRRID
jgi:antitoxin component of MazEF toxin-antitoxin module